MYCEGMNFRATHPQSRIMYKGLTVENILSMNMDDPSKHIKSPFSVKSIISVVRSRPRDSFTVLLLNKLYLLSR